MTTTMMYVPYSFLYLFGYRWWTFYAGQLSWRIWYSATSVLLREGKHRVKRSKLAPSENKRHFCCLVRFNLDYWFSPLVTTQVSFKRSAIETWFDSWPWFSFLFFSIIHRISMRMKTSSVMTMMMKKKNLVAMMMMWVDHLRKAILIRPGKVKEGLLTCFFWILQDDEDEEGEEFGDDDDDVRVSWGHEADSIRKKAHIPLLSNHIGRWQWRSGGQRWGGRRRVWRWRRRWCK